MTTFIKTGFWQRLKHPFKSYKGWLNLDQFVREKARPYKVYSALIDQVATSAPTAVELENTLGTVTWSRLNKGQYFATLDKCYRYDKIWCCITTSTYGTNNTAIAGIAVDAAGLCGGILYNKLFISTVDPKTNAPSFQDDFLNNASVEIRVYD